MLRFNNDYSQAMHPAILTALEKDNKNTYGGYGLDEWCQKAAQAIQKYLGPAAAEIHFLLGGTQVNYTIIAAALRPYQSVLCADTGHIYGHETGAVENTGHKIQALPAQDGKITAKQIAEAARAYQDSSAKEHITQPGMVYLSFPTEQGTLYSRAELLEIHKTCKEYGLYLFVDGARLGYGLGSAANDLTMKDLAAFTDVFYIGGTKCGAMFGEAVVLLHPALKKDFRSYMKQNGAMLAKGWLLGLQFHALFADGLYFSITQAADVLAMQLKAAFAKRMIPFFSESFTNQQFVLLTREQREKLAQKYIFEDEGKFDEKYHCVRFCTSWNTSKESVEALVQDILSL